VEASAEAASAPNLHKNPESLQTVFPASARPAFRDSLAEEQAKRMASWRAWDFRNWRLQRYMTMPQDGPTAGS
jgi:hypothetical protein